MDCCGPIATTRAPEQTRAFGRRLAEDLGPNDCLALYGDLGSGKTCLVQGVCEGLGVTDAITSPTFILVNVYEGRLPDGGPIAIHHVDLYRLSGPDELIDLGWDDYLGQGGLCLVEWADRAEGLLPADTVRVHIEAPEEMVRHMKLTHGD